ncbi:MAG TPA: Mut7-C RNAse domain-containing protein [Bryobacteraceae bacterium]
MRAYFRFYAELNDHLPLAERFQMLEKQFSVSPSVKDMIESFGVPHAEVELILVNGNSVDFFYPVRDGDRIAVYPVFEALDVTPELRIRREPLRQPKFVLDVHLGRLAAYLRLLGFDTAYRSCASDPDLARISRDEKRILLTRDRGLLKRSAVTHGYWLRETDSRRQAAEIVKRFHLQSFVRPFTRCLACNAAIAPVAKKSVRQQVPERIWEQFAEFQKCLGCGRIYWPGSHHTRMVNSIAELMRAAGAD